MTTSPQKKTNKKKTHGASCSKITPLYVVVFYKESKSLIFFRVVHLEINYSGNDFFPVMPGDEGTEAGDM